jgi:hypothetical protein
LGVINSDLCNFGGGLEFNIFALLYFFVQESSDFDLQFFKGLD